MRAMKYDEAPAGNAGLREGTLVNKVLMTGTEGRPDNYTLGIGGVVGGYNVPRHHHNFEQVRYGWKGETKFGEKTLHKGWVGFFPEGQYYGPQSRADGSGSITWQFGGPSGWGYLSRKEQKEARTRLEQRGKFEKGSYAWTDEGGRRHNQDAFEAVYEEFTGQKVVYPEPRYDDIIMMNPATYAWVEKRPGLSYKWLGTFGERGTRTGFIKLLAGAAVQMGTHDAAESMVLVEGEVTVDGRTYPQYTAFGFEPNEGAVTMKATRDTEILVLQLPKF